MSCSSSSIVFLTENVFKECFLFPAIDKCVIQTALWALQLINNRFHPNTNWNCITFNDVLYIFIFYIYIYPKNIVNAKLIFSLDVNWSDLHIHIL